MAGNAKEYIKALEYFKREVRLEWRSLKERVKFCSDTCDGTKAIGGDVKALRQEIEDKQRVQHSLHCFHVTCKISRRGRDNTAFEVWTAV